MLTKENFIRLIDCCTALEYLDDTIYKAFGGSIGQSDFHDVFKVYDVLKSESRFKSSRDGMDSIVEILRNTALTTEEKYNKMK